ncbi:MAG TPA: ATP-binding cassette domain-containing protein [Candidatus Angelobacter sp.]|jgi:ABC-2 type transport system ATP-binding protein|nr:ATP-binding cassette domain-containing protein [Candidatus Angelobacter sp.]
MTDVTPIACDDLHVSFGEVHAVDGVSFRVEAGEVYGLLGPNGAGKTTTIRVITTLVPPESGGVRVFGLDVRRDAMRVRHAIGYLPQQLSADGGLTGYENVWLFARLFDLPRRERESRIRDSLHAMGLDDVRDRMVSTYSGGMVRRLELAQALVNRPALLILDEPTIGLDPLARAGVWDHVRELREQTGMTVLLTTHYMEEADELCDRVALMHRGRLRATGSPSQLKAELGDGATLDDVFRRYAGDELVTDTQGFKDVRRTRRTAGRLG